MKYLHVMEACKPHRCDKCEGAGGFTDVMPGDTSFNCWECEACDGTGWKDGLCPITINSEVAS